MKEFLFLFLSAALLLACANEGKRPVIDQAEGVSAEAPADADAVLAAEPRAASATGEVGNGRQEKEEDAIGTRPANQPPQSGQTLVLQAQNTAAKAGSKACIDVKVQGFNNLLSMQYTMAWDAKVLAYQGVDKPGLPMLSNQNFGAHRTAEGLLTFVWIDGSLSGVTLPDNSTIFSVCFEVKGKSGQSSVFRFIESPTPFESVNLAEELVAIKPLEGKLIVE
jgi:hypothetical protein